MLRSLVAFAVLALLTACGSAPPPPTAGASLTVSVASVQQQVLEQRLSASGAIAPWQEMSLGVELSGLRVAELLVEVGDPVRAGQPLLRLDNRGLAMQLQQAQAALAQAEAQLSLASANARRGEALKRQQLLAQGDADQLIAGEALAQAQLQSARAQRDQAHLALDFTTLRAPRAGVIARRQVEPGQVVASGATLLTLIRDGRLEWRAELPEAALLQVRPGMVVALRTGAGQVITGKVRAVAPALNPQSRTGTVYADLPHNEGVSEGLRAGMYAAGELHLGAQPQRTLPDAAIVERDGYRYVFVLGKGDQVAQRRVEIGARQNGLIELLSGVADGEQVVAQGAGFLSDGDRVKVVAGDPDAKDSAP